MSLGDDAARMYDSITTESDPATIVTDRNVVSSEPGIIMQL